MRLVEVPLVNCEPRPIDAASLGRNSFQRAQNMAQPNDTREDLNTHSNLKIEKAG